MCIYFKCRYNNLLEVAQKNAAVINTATLSAVADFPALFASHWCCVFAMFVIAVMVCALSL